MVATCGAPAAGSPASARGRAQLAGSDGKGGRAGGRGGGEASARGLTLWRPRAPAAVRGGRWGWGGKQTLSSSPAGVLPEGARVRVAGGAGGRRGCVTLGAMFAASRGARPGGTRPAQPPRGQPRRAPAAGQAGLRAPRAGCGRGWSAGGWTWLSRPGLAVDAGPAAQGPGGEEGALASEGRAGGGGVAGSPLGCPGSGGRGLARARGAGEGRAQAAEVAQPPPLPRPSLKKGRGSRHFSSLKIKLSPPCLPLPVRLRGLPHCRSFKAGPARPGPAVITAASLSLAAAADSGAARSGRLAPRCGRAAAPSASRGAPQADTAPCWRALASLGRRRSRLRARPCLPAPPGGVRGSPAASLGPACTGGSRALRRRLLSSRELSVLPAPPPPPFLKGRCQEPAPPGPGGLCPRKCTSAAARGLQSRAAAVGAAGGRAFPRRPRLPHPRPAAGRHAGQPRLFPGERRAAAGVARPRPAVGAPRALGWLWV